MKLTFKILAVILILGFQLKAQDMSMSVKQQIEKLSPLVGQWEGTGWYQQGPNNRYEIKQTENVESILNGTLLLVEGKGYVNDSLAFNAMAFFSYDPYKKEYVIESHLMDGKATVAKGFFKEDGTFQWGFEFPNGQGQIRYIITFDESNWHETGEYSRDGNQWYKTFEMNLTRNN
ncbi:MAG: DUF1579 family protein [Cyclobacteriaceae bacterium]|nr:DUF1579 family protein [Cyclobacteriaceae bacterium]